jgi:hypothetical protein
MANTLPHTIIPSASFNLIISKHKALSPSDFTIQILAGNPIQPFLETSDGTEVTIESGAYEVIILDAPESILDPVPVSRTWGFSEDCIGSIVPNENKVCTITAVYEEGIPGTQPIDARPNLSLS